MTILILFEGLKLKESVLLLDTSHPQKSPTSLANPSANSVDVKENSKPVIRRKGNKIHSTLIIDHSADDRDIGFVRDNLLCSTCDELHIL